jgi:N utilization substance protein B
MTDNKKIPPVKKRNNLGAAPEKRVVKLKTGSAKAKNMAARLAAVQVLYQMRMNNQDAKSAVQEFIERRIGFELEGDKYVPADQDLLRDIVMGVNDRWADIDGIVSKALADGKKTDIETLLESILRAGTFELMGHGQIDAGIIINDYLNVTNSFYEGNESKIVNAILDKISKKVRE